MARRLLTPSHARPVRLLLLGALCSMGGALLVRGATLLLPGEVLRSMSERTYSALVLAMTLVLCAAVYVRGRRKRSRPSR
ncbi:hypothetical protein [Streptomyces sp. NPDC006368]|uniref:hypothetical protein n=1 Tax=Streptomyces sp. NPDC006368 TaxID=3156760 RepID=UPI00339F1572